MKLKRLAAAVLAATMMATSLSGCGGTAQKEEGKSDQVTLRFAWWGDEGRHKATLEAIDLYTKRNPNVKIEAEFGGFDGYKQKISTQLAGQTAPDIVQLNANWMPEFSSKGDFFVDLNEKSDLIDVSGFDKKFLNDFCVFDKKLVALPTGMNAETALINLESAKKFGINIDLNQKIDWDDIIEMGRKVNQQDPKSYLICIDPRLAGIYVVRRYMQQLTGNQFINDDYTIGFKKEDLAAGLELVKKMYDNKVFQPAADSAAFTNALFTNPKMAKGELVMAFGWTSNISEVNKLIGADNVGVFPSPMLEGAKDTALLVRPAQVTAIPKSSKNVDEAVKFLNFFYNDADAARILKDVRSVPSVEKARKLCADEGLLDKNSTITIDYGVANIGMAENGPSTNGEIETIVANAVEKIAYGKGSPQTVADETIALIKNVLDTLKK